MAELERLLDFARQTIHEAGRLTLGYFDRSLEIIDKADGSPVTVADREAEAYIRKAIERHFPTHGIHGEEHGVKEPTAGCSYNWFIDPIDGTKSFIHGVPLYTNLLGLQRDGRIVLGIIGLPALGQLMAAADGLGCTLNGRKVRVSAVSEVPRSVFLSSSVEHLERKGPGKGWKSLWNASKFNRTWGDGYGYVMVASGRAEAMFDGIVEPYDIAPMPVIMRESGGCFFDWNGEENIYGRTAVACNAELRGTILEALAGRE